MDHEKLFLGSIMVVCFILSITVFALLFISPIYEKNRYTELTGIEVSYLDAFFMELDPSKHVIIVDEKRNITSRRTLSE